MEDTNKYTNTPFMIQGSSEPLKLMPLKLMRINGIIFPVVCDTEDAQIYALIERKSVKPNEGG